MSKFERIMNIESPYYLPNKDPKKNYGRGGIRLLFILKGPKGAITFSILTNDYCLDDKAGWTFAGESIGRMNDVVAPLMAWGIDVHSPTQMYDGQKPYPCEWIKGGKCYGDGSPMAGAELLKKWAKAGVEPSNDVIWETLMEWYKSHFTKKDGPKPLKLGEMINAIFPKQLTKLRKEPKNEVSKV